MKPGVRSGTVLTGPNASCSPMRVAATLPIKQIFWAHGAFARSRHFREGATCRLETTGRHPCEPTHDPYGAEAACRSIVPPLAGSSGRE